MARRRAALQASNNLYIKLKKKFDPSHLRTFVDLNGDLSIEVRRISKDLALAEGRDFRAPDFGFQRLENSVPGKISASFSQKYITKSYEFPVYVTDKTRHEVVDCSDDYYLSEYRPVPGGCNFDYGSLACRAENNDNGEYVMLTSGHGINQARGNDTYISQPKEGCDGLGSSDWSYIGNLDYSYSKVYNPDPGCCDFDFGYIPLFDSVDATNELAADGGGYKQYPIEGIRTWDWVVYDGDSSSFVKQGEQTGVTGGSITKVDNSDGQRGFEADIESYYGDSSGCFSDLKNPFTSDPDRLFIGVLSWGYNTSSGRPFEISGGNHVETIEYYAGVTVK